MISLLGDLAPNAPDVSFPKKFFEDLLPPDFGYKKAPHLGAPFTWLLSGFDSLSFELLKVILNEVD